MNWFDSSILASVICAGAAIFVIFGLPEPKPVAWNMILVNGKEVWKCTSKANGQWVQDEHCFGIKKIDYWPGPTLVAMSSGGELVPLTDPHLVN